MIDFIIFWTLELNIKIENPNHINKTIQIKFSGPPITKNTNSPINNPNHDHCHHLSADAQKKWANEIAIPKISNIL